MVDRDPFVQEEEKRVIAAMTKAWNDRFAAENDAHPTLADVLWIVAKNGFTKEVAKSMNLSKATRECENLQREMREVMDRWGHTQLRYYCNKGMTASVRRMLYMKNIDVEAKTLGRNEHRHIMTSLHVAAYKGHLSICRLLINNGANIEARESVGRTPLCYAAVFDNIEIVRLLCDRGAEIEARDFRGMRPLHWAAMNGHISIIKELIEKKDAEINARDNGGRTALTVAREEKKDVIVNYLVERGGIE